MVFPLCIEHRLDSLHFSVYACIHRKLPPHGLKAIVQAYLTLSSRRTPFALRWAFPTAIDYYGVLRPRITTLGAATPVPRGDKLCRFPCSVGMSLPGLRLHLYTGGPISTVRPLYRQATRSHMRLERASPLLGKSRDLVSRTIPNVPSPVNRNDASTMVCFLAISGRS